MTRRLLCFGLFAGLLAGGLAAQTQPAGYFTTACIKVQRGKGTEYRQFINDYSSKLNKARVSAGDVAGWTLLRAVIPAGEEARCDYVSVTRYKGAPIAPDLGALEKGLQKAGIQMKVADFLAKRDSLTYLVASEMWRSRIRVADAEKGDYMYVNFMKVHNMPEYAKFEQEVWRPLAEAWVKDGKMKAWAFSTAMLPGGTERKYAAVSVDVFPSWDAAFQPLPVDETFKKVHSGRNLEETFQALTKLRDLARRELYVVHDKATGAPPSVSQR